MQTTTETVSRQKLSAELRAAGFSISSEGRNGQIGYSTRSEGFIINDNGERVHMCRKCMGKTFHKSTCPDPSSAAKNWKTWLELDGTVTVEFQRPTDGRFSSADEMREQRERACESIVNFLVSAGYTVIEKSPTSWIVTA
jgi:hypothetical protein